MGDEGLCLGTMDGACLQELMLQLRPEAKEEKDVLGFQAMDSAETEAGRRGTGDSGASTGQWYREVQERSL